MAERPDATENAHSSSLSFRNIPTLVAGLLGALALVVYPLGFLVYWIQIWREYTHEAAPALYAASLMPAPVVAGGALRVLYTASLVAVVSMLVSSAWTEYSWYGEHRRYLQNYVREGAERPRAPSRFGKFVTSRWGRIVSPVMEIFMAVTVLWALDIVNLDSASDVFYYVCAVAVAFVSGLLGASLLSKAAHSAEGNWLSDTLPWVTTITVGTLIAAMFLIPLQSPSLTTVRFSASEARDAHLLGHSQGYWYVIKSGERNVVALPDEAVGNATISGR